jgi:Ni/Co efflux regulator RcnB
MRSKLVFSVLVVASLFGATTLASAQTKPAAGTSAASDAAKSNAMASMRHHHHYRHHHMGYSRAQMDRSRPGGRPVSRKAAD